ncbi:chemotaxis protein CheW [Solimicrobium silvestre]|uniref:CheW-like domain n=1 Tax=Solimicrobium silvestre TaxID=2099400 RepID=A0A2S9H511_9BURK|nr:chemotaxis protein CheW [Solimicrobium silvestre]PRC95069.1 CheW-like domain [Solimicrobium silvestre]
MNQVNTAKLDKPIEDKRGERRERLREFQSQLLERMQAARASDVISSNQLGVMIGQTRYLLNLREAGEIVSIGQISHVPLTRDWYLGLLNIRGNLIGVVDIQRFQGQPGAEINPDCRVIAFSAGLAFNAGLLVTKVLGLRNVAEMTVQQNPADGDSAWLQQSYLDSNNQTWFELSLTNLIQDGDFLHIGL